MVYSIRLCIIILPFEQWNKTSSDIVDVVFLDANNKEVDLNNIQNYAKVKNIKVTAKKPERQS